MALSFFGLGGYIIFKAKQEFKDALATKPTMFTITSLVLFDEFRTTYIRLAETLKTLISI